MKGWYFCSNPAEADGESTIWYATYWAFIARYLGKRFNKRYCLNPEASLLLHTGNTTIPGQVYAVAKEGGSTVLTLPSNTSLRSLRKRWRSGQWSAHEVPPRPRTHLSSVLRAGNPSPQR